MIELNPKIEVQNINGMMIVRDDLLEGGTKQRGLYEYIKGINKKNICYCSGSTGYAQIALTIVCNLLNKNCIIFTPQCKVIKQCTNKVIELGGIVKFVKCGYLSVLNKRCKEFCAQHEDSLIVPFGLECKKFKQILEKNIRDSLVDIDINKEWNIWLVYGSGTIYSVLKNIFINSKFNIVKIGIDLGQIKDCNNFKSKYKFNQACKNLPPYPSNKFYDAKLWEFVEPKENTLIWNVAK